MALAIAGVVSAHAGAVTGTTGTLASTPIIGDLIARIIGSYGVKSGDYTTSTPTDSKGNAYSIGGSVVSASPSANAFEHVSIWWSVITTGGASMTFTSAVAGAPTSAETFDVAIHITGNGASPYNADMDGNTGSSATPLVGPSSPAPAASSIFIAGILCDRSDGTPPTGWNNTGTVPGLTAGMVTSLTLKFTHDFYCAVQLASAAQTPTWGGFAGATVYGGAVASFAPAGVTGDTQEWRGAFPPARGKDISQVMYRREAA